MARWGRIAYGLALLAAFTIAGRIAASADEYGVKAAFLLNFAKLVEWPADAAPAAGMPIVFGVVGDESVTRAFTSGLEGARVDGHAVEVRSVAEAADVAGCHIVFVASDRSADAVVAAAPGHAALSVGEADGFATHGGVINFFSEGKKLRFEINTKAADRAGLKISSRLLRLAKLVSEP